MTIALHYITPEQQEQASRSALAAQIAAQLGETQDEPCYTIRLALKLVGPATIQRLVRETLQVEASGGMKTKDGKRRRSPGGVFFTLLKDACTPGQREQLFAESEQAIKPLKRRNKKRKNA